MEAAAAGVAGGDGVNNEDEEAYELASSIVDQMPPGFRFHPTDWEIIIHYLLNKVIDRWFRAVAIGDIDLNNCEPWDLPQKAKIMGENEWFFFFEKETKYPSGLRTNRATPSGYWKATGKDKEIYKPKKGLVGMKKTLVFYKGRAPKGEKTNWVIHEYRLHGDFSAYNLSNDAMEKWAVCRVFHKKNGVNTNPGVELGRIDSFVDRYLLDSPTPLPPLTDYSSRTDKPNSSFAAHQFKATTLVPNNLQELDQNNLFSPNPPINSNNQYSSTLQNLNPNPYYSTQMPVFPYQSVSNLVYQHQDGTIERYTDHKPNSRILAPDIYVGGKEPERIMCKMEPISLNRSAISPSSQDTGLDCKKLESESSKACDEVVDEEGLCFSPNISDLDSLWSC